MGTASSTAGTQRQNAGGDAIALRLHNTDVVTFYPNGSLVLDSGGWLTPTTKERMNRVSTLRVWQERGQWYFTWMSNPPWYAENPGTAYLYADGVRLGPRGGVDGARKRNEKQDKEAQALSRRVAKYAKAFAAALIAGDVPAPSGGDCWFCCMVTESGLSLGKASGNPDHIKSHIEDSYFVPSLLVRAVDAFPVSEVAKWSIGSRWQDGGEPAGEWADGIAQEQIASSVRRYVRRQLGLAS